MSKEDLLDPEAKLVEEFKEQIFKKVNRVGFIQNLLDDCDNLELVQIGSYILGTLGNRAKKAGEKPEPQDTMLLDV